MDKRIIKYIHKNKVITLATSLNQQPYCANCYYAFDEKNGRLIFLSDEQTRHIQEALKNDLVAGTITTNHLSVAKIKGIQFTGKFMVPNEDLKKDFYALYYDRFPFAKAKPEAIWGIALEFVKMTDNTLGFGTKISWEKGND